jgi:hypothetical protein
MTDFVTDTFTDTNGTTLTSHTTDTGASWLLMLSSSVVGTVQSNSYTPFASSTAAYRTSATPPSADYYAQMDIIVPGTSPTGGIGPSVRCSSSANTYYALRYQPNTLAIIKVVAGVLTSLSSISLTLTGTQTLRLEVNGSSLVGFVGGVQKVPASGVVTDTSVTATGFAGLRSASTNILVDNFSAGPLGGSTVLDYSVCIWGARSSVQTWQLVTDPSLAASGQSAATLTSTRLLDAAITVGGASSATVTSLVMVDATPARMAASSRSTDGTALLDAARASSGASARASSSLLLGDVGAAVVYATAKTLESIQVAAEIDFGISRLGASSQCVDSIKVLDRAAAAAGARSISTFGLVFQDGALAIVGAYTVCLDDLLAAPVTETELVRAIVRFRGDGVLKTFRSDGAIVRIQSDGVTKGAAKT